MKLRLLLVLLLSWTCWSVTFEWDANVEPDLAGYKFYYGPSSRNYTNVVDVGLVTRYTILNSTLPLQTNYFAVTAYNTSGLESLTSNEVTYAVPPATPTGERKVEEALLLIFLVLRGLG